MSRGTPGEKELEVLRFITEHPGVTVRTVAREFGEPRGLARTTVLTMMENLRAKGYLSRKKGAQAYEYSAVIGKPELLRRLVSEFVANTLKGSVSPVTAYLAGGSEVSDEELDELHAVVQQLRAEREARGR